MLAQGTCKCARPLRGSFFMPEYECRSALTLHVCLSCCVPPTPRAPLVLHGTCIASSFAELAQHFVCACTAPASRAPFVTRCPCRSRVRVAVRFVASWLLRWRWLLVDGCEDVCGLSIAMAAKFVYGFNDKFICLFLHFYYIYYYLRNTIDFCLVQFLLFVGAFYHVTL